MSQVNLACFPEDALKICRLSEIGVKVKTNRLLNLQDLSKVIEQSIREAGKSISDHKMYRVGELTARLFLLACDITLSTLEEKTGPAGIVINKAYDGSKLLADTFTNSVDMKSAALLLQGNLTTIASMSADYMGKKGVSKTLGHIKSIVTITDQLWSAFSDNQGFNKGASGIQSAVKTNINLLRKLQQSIREIEQELEFC